MGLLLKAGEADFLHRPESLVRRWIGPACLG
jgi:hypothetical protein